MLQGRAEPIAALNQEISWGGVLFTVAEPLPAGVDSVLLTLPWARGQLISIHAAILRTRPLPDGRHLVAARFSSLLPESELRLEKLLKMLSAEDRAGERHDSTDLFRELDVIVNDIDEFRHVLAQVAAGRCVVHALNLYDKNQSIGLSVEGPDNLPALRLRARVVEIQQLRNQECDWADVHRLTLELEHPIESVAPLVDSLLGLLPASGDTLPVVESGRPGNTFCAVAGDARGAIEMGFTGVLTALTAVWGDPGAFDALFRKLIFGDVGQSASCWPADVWEELVFLQNVHHQAYGPPPGSQASFW